MIIRTSQERNAVECCCEWPECEGPRTEFESLMGLVYLAGYTASHIYFPEDADLYPKAFPYPFDNDDFEMHKTLRREGDEEGWQEWSRENIVYVELGGVDILEISEEDESSSTDPNYAVPPYHEILSEPVTVAESRTIGIAAIETALDWDDEDFSKGSSDTSIYHKANEDWGGSYTGYTLSVVYVRYRVGIPEDFEGSVYELQWDEVTASPEWWDWFDGGMEGAEPTPAPTAIPRDWTYHGTDEFSDWFEIPLADDESKTRCMNMMVVCWKSARLGVVPTAVGDSYAG